MTSIEIPDSDRRIQYTATAGQTVFPYDFPIYDDDDLVVKRTRSGTTTILTKTTDYTVSDVGVEAGGNVTLVTGATLSDIMTIYGSSPIDRQGQNFQQSGDFLADDLNRQLNKQIIISQELQSQIDNCLKLGEESTYSGSLALPAPTANKALLWNSSANALINSTDDFNDIVTDATTQAGIATAQATAANVARVAAELAQTNAETAETNAETAETNAEAAQALAEDWASKTNGQVDITDYSSKAYAIGGTGVTSAIGAAKEWAITAEDTEVTSGNYSALHHAAKAAASAAAAIVAKIEWQGAWSAGTYNANDAVEHNGSSWIATTTTTEEPSGTATDWDLLAQKGTDGAGGDVSSNTTSSVDGEIALFSGTGGKTIKRATGNGYVKTTSGVFSNVTTIPPNEGGTGVANNAASTLTISGNYATTLTVSNTTNVTLPTSGTLMSNPMTTAGDLIIGDTSGVPKRLAKGIADFALYQGATEPDWRRSYRCQAWVNINGTGTPSARGSGNVSSITDNGTGDYTINFTTNMPDVKYSWVGSGGQDNYTQQLFVSSPTSIAYTSWKTVSSLRIWCVYQNNTAVSQDPIDVSVAIFR